MRSFDEMGKEAAKRFIRTVAIIDDEATYDVPSRNDKDKMKTVKPPVNSLMTGNQDTDSSATNEDSTDAGFQDNHDDFSLLDAKVVINAFADMGIACCIQRPENEEPPLDRAAKLAASVDVLVIDWALDNENMSLPRDIIKKILEEDKNTGGRMRLIVVYTAQPYVDQMLTDLKKDADAVYDDVLVMDKRRLFIKSDCLRIVILNKKATVNPPTDARIVPFDQLPDNIISEYTELVKGVLPGATLHGIAAMRENTHKLLSILNSHLDGAYCLHRALIPEPSDSVDFAMNLITNEIETVIQSDIQARQFVDRKGIDPWLDNISYDELPKETVQQWLDKGGISKKNGKKFVKALYRDNQTEGLKGCRELSRLQCTTRDMAGRLYYSTSQKPALQLGTILKTSKNDADKWFLCITPVCDCVRLKEETNFLFLTLYSGTVDNADIIIKIQDGTFEPLIVKNKKLGLLTIPFKPTNERGRIHTHRWRKEWRIKSSVGTSYQWVGELRYPKALAIVHYVAANTSRVGVDEFEWLRGQATL